MTISKPKPKPSFSRPRRRHVVGFKRRPNFSRLRKGARRQAEAEAGRLAAEEEARRLAEAEAKGLAAEEETRHQAEAEAERLAVEEEARRQAEAEAARLAAEEEAHRLAEAERLEEDNSSVEKATIGTPFDVEITTALLLPLSEAKGEDHVYHLFDAMLLEKSGRVYASLPAVKSGAACISWVNAGDQALIHYVGLAYASPTLELAKLVALRTCRKKVAKTPEDCECVMVYENDVRVLRDSVGN
jgi:flagellar biosynthesis GTPase FlhF